MNCRRFNLKEWNLNSFLNRNQKRWKSHWEERWALKSRGEKADSWGPQLHLEVPPTRLEYSHGRRSVARMPSPFCHPGLFSLVAGCGEILESWKQSFGDHLLEPVVEEPLSWWVFTGCSGMVGTKKVPPEVTQNIDVWLLLCWSWGNKN